MGEITARIKKFVLTIPEVIIVDASRGTIVTETEAHVSPINQLVHHPINEPVNHHWQLTSPLVSLFIVFYPRSSLTSVCHNLISLKEKRNVQFVKYHIFNIQ